MFVIIVNQILKMLLLLLLGCLCFRMKLIDETGSKVLANLLRSAIESTEGMEGSRIAIETRRTDDADIEIRVVDNGPGLSAECRAAMLQPGSGQLGNGRGLGLAISRSLVEAHGGTIRVEETPGGGATFAFTVPANS